VATANGRTVEVWAAPSGRRLTVLRGNSNAVRSVAFSPDGELLVTTSATGATRLWSVGTGRTLHALRIPNRLRTPLGFAAAGYAACSRRGGMVMAEGEESVALWAVPSGRSLGVINGRGEFLTGALFSPDGKLLLTTDLDGTARLWAVPSGRLRAVLRGHTSG